MVAPPFFGMSFELNKTKQNRDEHFTSVLQVVPRQVRTDLYDNLRTRTVLLSLESGTRLPHWEHTLLSLSLLLSQRGSGARASKHATKIPTIFWLTFS